MSGMKRKAPSEDPADKTKWLTFIHSLPNETEINTSINQVWKAPGGDPDKKQHMLLRRLWSRMAPITGDNLNYQFLFPENVDPTTDWYTTESSRRLYEIMLASYLPRLKDQTTEIDFKVSIDDGKCTIDSQACQDAYRTESDDSATESDSGSDEASLGRCPDTIANYVNNWVEFVKDDPALNNSLDRGKDIVRRVWVMGLFSDFVKENARRKSPVEYDCKVGHHLLVIVERKKSEECANIFVVDNMPTKAYRFPVHLWLMSMLRESFQQKMPRLKIGRCILAINRLPHSIKMASCMSISFRAMVMFSFLNDPFPFLIQRHATQESIQWMKLMYLHLEQMRRYFLYEVIQCEETIVQPVFIPEEEGPDPPSFQYSLHNLATSFLWMVDMTMIKNQLHPYENIKLYISQHRELCYRLYFNNDSQSRHTFRSVMD